MDIERGPAPSIVFADLQEEEGRDGQQYMCPQEGCHHVYRYVLHDESPTLQVPEHSEPQLGESLKPLRGSLVFLELDLLY